jgi:hypothetical protein
MTPQTLPPLDRFLPPLAAGMTGRALFGGIGGALLGAAIYSVFIKPSLFPADKVTP